MNNLQNIVAYFCTHYPHKGELSKARLTKLVYLADWYSSLVDGKQLTDIKWVFNHYGPYVDDVVHSVQHSNNFKITHEQTMFGSDKFLIGFNGTFDKKCLSERVIAILNAVINNTKSLYFNDFIDYVYSTYPIVSKNRYSSLNLVQLANEYKHQQAITA